MEQVRIRLADSEFYDKVLAASLPEAGDLTVVTKDSGTVEGRPVVLMTFTVQLPDGTTKRAQTVVTGRNFSLICDAFRGRYGDNGDKVVAIS